MKIAFIGDSFCGGNTDASWTNILARRLDAEVICRGRGGISIGQAYFDLIDCLADADLYFMLYTDHRRLFNSQLYPLNAVSCMDFEQRGLTGMVTHDGISLCDAELWDAGLRYFKHLYNDQYHELVHWLIIRRCDEILAHHISSNPHKRAYHFHCFPTACSVNEFASGPCCRETMLDLITRHEIGVTLGDRKDNHMTVQLNAAVAERLAELLDADVGKWFDLP